MEHREESLQNVMEMFDIFAYDYAYNEEFGLYEFKTEGIVIRLAFENDHVKGLEIFEINEDGTLRAYTRVDAICEDVPDLVLPEMNLIGESIKLPAEDYYI